jgi:hypothetical protein
MPQRLWQEAVRLAQTYGVGVVARSLRLDYGKLSKRVKADLLIKTSGPAFVEVSPLQPVPMSRECVVEMKRPDGSWVVIRMSTNESLSSLCESLLR